MLDRPVAHIIGSGSEARLVADMLRATDRRVYCLFHNAFEGKSGGRDELRYYGELDENAYEAAFRGSVYRGIGDNAAWMRWWKSRGSKVRLGGVVGSGVCWVDYQHLSADELQSTVSGVLHHGVHIGAGAQLGIGVLINTRVVIEHDCVIGDHVSIAPNATLLGGVHVGAGSFIGAGAVVTPGIVLGENCFVDAGSVVHKPMPPDSRWRHARGELQLARSPISWLAAMTGR